ATDRIGQTPLVLPDPRRMAAGRAVRAARSPFVHGAAGGGPQPSRAIGSRSMVRTWRVRPASVRTNAAGMTPEVSFSITAASPAERPLPEVRTRSPLGDTAV